MDRDESHEVQQGEMQVLQLGRSTSTHWLGGNKLESSFAEKVLDVLSFNINDPTLHPCRKGKQPPGLH